MRWISILFCWLVVVGTARSQESRLPDSSDVAQLALLLRGELEVVSRQLGAGKALAPKLTLTAAGVREQYAQGLLLARKAAQLLLEQGRQSPRAQPAPIADPKPPDLYSSLKDSLEMVRTVKTHLGIGQTAVVPDRNGPILANGYLEIVRCNRVLDQLLRRKADPADLYLRINKALGIAMRICLSSRGRRIPPDPPQLSGQTMEDVCAMLKECHDLEGRMARLRGGAIPQVAPVGTPGLAEAEELSALLLAGLLFRALEADTKGTPLEAVYQEERDPAKLVQRGALLREYLKVMLEQVEVGQAE